MSVDDSATSDQRKHPEGAESEVRKNEQPGQNGGQTNAASDPQSYNQPVLQRESNSGVTDADWRNPVNVPAAKTHDELIEHLSSALEEMASSSSQPRQTNQNLPQQPLGPAQQIRSSLPPGTLPAKPQARQDAPQHFFVLEGMAPPATPPTANSVQLEKTQPVQVEPQDGLQVRRMIATQQRMPAAQNSTSESEPTHEAPNSNAPNPNAQKSNSAPESVQARATASGTNQVQLPPMFGNRQSNLQQENATHDEDQHKARTGIQAISKAANQSPQAQSEPTQNREVGLPKPPDTTPQEKQLSDLKSDSKPSEPPSSQTRSHSVLTGHNFAPRQADPRSTMSAMTALPSPVPQNPPTGQPVSPLGAALASSLPANPPTGHYVIPAALRDDSTKTEANPAPPAVLNSNPNLSNPVGPATSRPIPKIDQSGAVQVQNNQQQDSGPYAKASPTKEITGPMAGVDDDDEAPSDATLLAQQTSFSATAALDPLSRPAMNFRQPTQNPIEQTPPHSVRPPDQPPTQPSQHPPRPAPQQPAQPPVNFPLPHNFGKWPQGTDSSTQAWGSSTANAAKGTQPNSQQLSLPQEGQARATASAQPLNPQTAAPAPSYQQPTNNHAPSVVTTTAPNQTPPSLQQNPPANNVTPSNNFGNDLTNPAPANLINNPATPPHNAPGPNLPPFVQNQNVRRTFTDLREETGLVLPHTAPAPDPNQVLHEEFGKSVPGVTPVSKGFETKQAIEKREALEREREALNRIQLPARSAPTEDDTQKDHSAMEQTGKEKRREAPATEIKARRQGDSSRSQRNSNFVNENTGSRSMRTSRNDGASGPIRFLKQNWRVAIIASLAVPLVASVSALVFMQGQSFLNVAMSPSQRAGEEAFKEGNYDRAISYFNEAIKADDKRAGLYRDRARAYMGLQEYGAAITDYTSTLKLEPNFASARLDRAASYYFLGDYPKAIADYDELIKANDRNVDAYFGRGLCHSKLRQYDSALADLNKVSELKPDHPGVFEDVANIYLAQGKLNEAVDAYSHSLKNNKQDANAYYMRANTYRRMGKTSQALADFSAAIDVAPGRYEFYNDRGFAYYEDNKYKEAIADLSNALALYPNYEIARHNRQMACDKLIASIGTPKSAEQFGDLAYAYFNLESYSQALSAANKALLQNAQYRPAMNIRAAIELKQKRFDYALTDAENILKIKADDKDALLTRARANLNSGRFEKAIKDYDTCVAENDNTSLFALRERALAHILANEGALAATDAQQFIDLNGWHNSLSGPTALLGWLAKRQLQDSDGAGAILSQAETQMKSTQWPYPIFKFLKREITLSQLASQAHNERQKTDVRTWSGFDHLLGGMREEAHNDFDWVKRSGFKDNDDYLLSNEQLKAETER